MRTTLPHLLALLVLTGCRSGPEVPRVSVCSSDDQCAAGEVCFSDGCGNPERDLAVEVLPDSRAGLNAQDFLVQDFRATQDLQLSAPAVVIGQITRGGQPYSGRVMLRLAGESALIPGRERLHSGTLTLEQGAYSMLVGTGVYSAQFLTADPFIPPMTFRDVRVPPGKAVSVMVELPPATSLMELAGTLVRSVNTPTPLGATMEVQAVDLGTQRPLSQRALVASDTGGFTLSISSETAQKERIGIQATPRETSTGAALVPRRLFTVSPRGPLPVLELGDFGEPVAVSGQVMGSDGRPIEGAAVYVDGRVQGGGLFTSSSVKTDADGRFGGLMTLRDDPSGELALWVVPPARSISGQLRRRVTIPAEGGSLGALLCPDRVPVQGQVRRPDGRDFPGVRVVARVVAPLEQGLPPPSLKVETATDENSTYTLHLDPAVWQLDFVPPEPLPRMSRLVRVRAELSPTGGNKIVQVPPFSFSRGRTVSGTITGLPFVDARDFVPMPFASVRFYRVATVDGRQTAELLAEGVSDDQATYSVVLPTR